MTHIFNSLAEITPCIQTPTEFIKWLESQPSDALFEAGRVYYCPIASWLNNERHEPYFSVSQFCILGSSRKGGIVTPTWMRQFISIFDFISALRSESRDTALFVAYMVSWGWEHYLCQ